MLVFIVLFGAIQLVYADASKDGTHRSSFDAYLTLNLTFKYHDALERHDHNVDGNRDQYSYVGGNGPHCCSGDGCQALGLASCQWVYLYSHS